MTSKKFPLCSNALAKLRQFKHFPDLWRYVLPSGDRMVIWQGELENLELALSKAEKKSYEAGRKNGRQDQLIITTNLFNDLRNKRFQFNDEVKMVIDMLKDEITRVSK